MTFKDMILADLDNGQAGGGSSSAFYPITVTVQVVLVNGQPPEYTVSSETTAEDIYEAIQAGKMPVVYLVGSLNGVLQLVNVVKEEESYEEVCFSSIICLALGEERQSAFIAYISFMEDWIEFRYDECQFVYPPVALPYSQGTYVLKATVDNGVVTKEWVPESSPSV